MKKKINTFPFSELMSNDLETLPLGAQAIEQSSISSSSSDSSISAAPGRVGKPPPQLCKVGVIIRIVQTEKQKLREANSDPTNILPGIDLQLLTDQMCEITEIIRSLISLLSHPLSQCPMTASAQRDRWKWRLITFHVHLPNNNVNLGTSNRKGLWVSGASQREEPD